METPQTSLPFDVAVSARDIESWRLRAEAIEDKINSLAAERLALMERIEIAERLFEMLRASSAQPAEQLSSRPTPQHSSATPRAASITITADTTFVDAVRQVIYAAVPKIAPFKVKEILAESALADRLVESDKGFYHAISRLAERGDIVRHNGWLFSPENFAQFRKDVDAGRVVDDKPVSPTRSPMGDAILEFVNANDGVTSKEVIVHLRKDEEFRAALTPNPTIAYNIISRLAKRGQVTKEKGRIYPVITPELEAKEPPDETSVSGPIASAGGNLR